MQDESKASSQLPQPPGEFETGSVVFEKYLIEKQVGEGGMGVVYKATNTLLDRTSALKVLPVDAFSAKEVVRFQNEARLLSRLKHANIAQVYDFGIGEGNRPYIEMEFLEGDTLQDAVDRNGPLPFDLFFEVFIQIAKGLSHAHEKGIIHRDVKTSNIMLSKDEDGSLRAVLLDFGVAQTSSDDGADRLTKPGAMIGSPFYMSPEQIFGGSATAASDIYSLCCVMVFALTGEPPFPGETVLETFAMHRDTEYPVEELRTVLGMPEKLCHVIATGLSKSPEDRQSSSDNLSEKLIELSTKLDDTESGVSRVNSSEKVDGSGLQKRRKLLIGSVVAALLLGLSAVSISYIIPKLTDYFNQKSQTPHVSSDHNLERPSDISDDSPLVKAIEGKINRIPDLVDPEDSKDKVDVSMADHARKEGDITYLQTALDTYKTVLGRRQKKSIKPPDKLTTRCLQGIYEINLSLGRYDELATLEQDILKYCPEGVLVVTCFDSFEKAAKFFAERDQRKEAERCHQSAIQILNKMTKSDSLESASQKVSVGASYLTYKNHPKAKLWLNRARAHLSKVAPKSSELFFVDIHLAHLYGELKDFKKAEQFYREAEKIWLEVGSQISPEYAGILYSGWTASLIYLGRNEDAERTVLTGLRCEGAHPVMLDQLKMIRTRIASESKVRHEVSH